MMDENLPFYDLYEKDFVKRLEFARDNGCNTMMITGDAEPQQNRAFLQRLGSINQHLSSPFRWIEMQTTGVLLDEPYLRFLRNHVGISTISVSLSSFDSGVNGEYNGTQAKLRVDLESLCQKIKKYDFNLRLSINLTDWFNHLTASEFFARCKEFRADQVTLRMLYSSNDGSEQAKWVDDHKCSPDVALDFAGYILLNGRTLEKLEYGRTKYSLHGMSTVVDNDCMSTDAKNELKYLILRPNCKLYSKWDDFGSLVF